MSKALKTNFPLQKWRQFNNCSKGEKVHLFFDTAIEEQSREYLSEDYFFTRRWLNLGGFTWIDPTVSLVHTGYYRFNGGSLALDSIELEKNKEESVDE